MTGFIIFLVIGVFFFIVAKVSTNKKKKIENLKQVYDMALNGTNKREALESGRAYYSALRTDGKLTIYDEQSLTNDLHTMKDFKS